MLKLLFLKRTKKSNSRNKIEFHNGKSKKKLSVNSIKFFEGI